MLDLSPSRRRRQTAAHQRIVITAGLPVDLAQRVDALAWALGTNRSKVIAAAIAEGLGAVAAQAGKVAAQQQQTVKE